MVQPLYNGNISQTFWRTANDNKLRGYAYSYDALNRLNTAYYRKGTAYSNNFNESLSYDKNGNILSLQRWGVPEDYGTVPAIPNMDDLSYTYFPNSNKLRKVSDGVASTKGFNDGVNLSTEYIYDPNANMKEDKNKGITEIKYNHLNLPTEIKFSNHQKIAYIYNALGTKIEKTVTNGSDISKTEYLDSFQYIDGELQFFPTSEGYVRKTDGTNRRWFDYVYNYTDHLGNIRLSYTTDPISGSTNNIKILEENNYYPFGLQHGSYNTPARDIRPFGEGREVLMVNNNPYQYKYQGQERQDELGLNWDSFKWRNYDYTIGRFMSVDPLAEDYSYNSTYAFQENKMGLGRELEGLELELFDYLKDKAGQTANYISTKTSEAKEWVKNNVVVEAEAIVTFGGQAKLNLGGGAKIGAGFATTEMVKVGLSTEKGTYSEKGDGKGHNFVELNANIPGTGKKGSAGFKVDYVTNDIAPPDGSDLVEYYPNNGELQWGVNLGPAGSLGPGVKGDYDFLSTDITVGSELNNDCFCVKIQGGTAVILGVEGELNIGIKR